ncbi:hypothetical protein CC80DRAFT_488424 [Byssothecium circinans]|uniref:Uncharacterized protein n=1 Tax=Byssothecium circinans TaxID=147558 RepID=A0A6A5UDS1_9PLEO|nr:hypothetical protein CC80DRAFT_488424 [Byssothecium circinans]
MPTAYFLLPAAHSPSPSVTALTPSCLMLPPVDLPSHEMVPSPITSPPPTPPTTPESNQPKHTHLHIDSNLEQGGSSIIHKSFNWLAPRAGLRFPAMPKLRSGKQAREA